MRPTDEQQAIIDAFATGEDICVEAGAGAAKTTTLKMIAEHDLDLSGLLLAFNVGIAEEARRRFPGTTACMTSHSLAMRSGMADRFRERIDAGSAQSKDVAEWLGIKRFFRGARGRRDVSTWKLASLAVQSVARFCQSDDDQIMAKHVPYTLQVEKERHDDLRRVVVPLARRIWDDVVDGGQLALGSKHLDHALKLYVLSDPTLPFDFLLIDEAQDTVPVLAGFARRQSKRDIQVVATGDSSQALYGWRGARDFLTEFDAKHRLTLTRSFRFGDAVADEANNFLRYIDAPIRLSGTESIDSRVGVVERPRAILCRTNAEVIEQVMAVQRAGRSVAILKGADSIAAFAQSAEDLKRGERARHPELSAFERWSDVVSYVQEEQPGGSFGTYVRLIERYGTQKVIEVASGCVAPSQAECVAGTVHSTKGLEWDSVLVDPGVLPGDIEAVDESSNRDAMMICYVAVTRARLELDATGLSGYHRRQDSLRLSKMRRAMTAVAA